MEKARCKNCEYCKYTSRQQTQQMRLGRKVYMCDNPDAKKLPSKAFGNKMECFIGFGNHKTRESELMVKTAPRWCPKNS